MFTALVRHAQGDGLAPELYRAADSEIIANHCVISVSIRKNSTDWLLVAPDKTIMAALNTYSQGLLESFLFGRRSRWDYVDNSGAYLCRIQPRNLLWRRIEFLQKQVDVTTRLENGKEVFDCIYGQLSRSKWRRSGEIRVNVFDDEYIVPMLCLAHYLFTYQQFLI